MEPRPTDSTREADPALFAKAVQEEPADLPPQALRYVELMSEVPEVRLIAFAAYGPLLRLWAVTDTYDVKANDAIFAREAGFYDEWPELEYDFNVVALEGRPLEWVLPDRLDVIWTRPGR
jgi:hypothetical protein